jgi:hypothetical protein
VSAPRWESALTVRRGSRIVRRVMPMMSRVLSLGLILLALPGLPGASAT